MGKIRLLRRLWNREAGTIMEANEIQESFAVNKGYAEPVIEKIEKKVEPVKRNTKVEKGLKKRSKK